MNIVATTLTLLVVLSFTASVHAEASTSEDALRREIQDLKKKNQALQAGFINQYEQIKLMKNEIARLKQLEKTEADEEKNAKISPKAREIWSAEVSPWAPI